MYHTSPLSSAKLPMSSSSSPLLASIHRNKKKIEIEEMDNVCEGDGRAFSGDRSRSPSADGSSYEGLSGGRALKKGPWTHAEDAILMDHVKRHGEGNWNAVHKYSGLSRCGKSCRLRWANHLRPNLKKGAFTAEEEQLIIELHAKLGNKWARMAAHLPGRTDNEIKNYWNTRIKRHQRAGLPLYPSNLCQHILNDNQLSHASDFENGNRQHSELLHSSRSGLYETIFDGFVTDQTLFWGPSSHNFSVSKVLNQFLGCHGYGNPATSCKWFNETKTLSPSSCASLTYGLPTFEQYAETILTEDRPFGPYFPVNSQPGHKSLSAFGGTTLSSHALNGSFSASQPLSGTVKLELPSFQYSEVDSSGSIISPPSPSEQDANLNILATTETVLPKLVSTVDNSSLLEVLLYEEQALRHASHEDCPSESNSSFASNHLIGNAVPNSCITDWDSCNRISTDASTFGNSPNTRSILMPDLSVNYTSGLDAKPVSAERISNFMAVDKVQASHMDLSRPDVLLDSDWFIWDLIGSPGEDLHDFKTQIPGASASSKEGHSLHAYPLNGIPPVC